MAATAPGIRRLCTGVDLKGYSSLTAPQQQAAQAVLDDLLTRLLDQAGVDRRLCERQAGGDGEFLLLPPGVDEPAVVAGLITGGRAAIAAANEQPGLTGQGIRLRLRMAVHEGVSHDAELGWAGQAVPALARMLTSEPLRRALDADTEAILAVALSEPVFRESVAQRYPGLDPDAFYYARLQDPSHDFEMDAWIHVPPAPGQEPARPAETSDPGALGAIQGLPPFAGPTGPGRP